MKKSLFTGFLSLAILMVNFVLPSDSFSKNYRYKKYYTQNGDSGAIRRSKNYLKSTQQQLFEKRVIVEKLKKKEKETSFFLSVLQQKLENTSIKLADTQYRYTLTQRQIKVTDQKLKDAEKELKEQINLTIKTVNRLYKYKYMDFLVFLFNSEDISSFMRRVVYFNYIIKQDNDIINGIKQKKEEIKQLKEDYKQKQVKIASISQKISEQKVIYEDQSQEQEEYLHQVQSKREIYEKEVRLLEQESDRIASMLKRLMEQQKRYSLRSGVAHRPITFKGGKFGWPCSSSNLTSNFGYRTHPIFGTVKLHTGIDIGAPSGTPIYAAGDGIVIDSGWMGGYGKAIIIDHGSGIATLYGHSSQIYVHPGQTVKRGQLIGAVGSTGFSTGPHLHFEVRTGGTPVNPLAYL